ncbi:MAG TPA: SEC-C metal-binding domain-containing protein [Bryobacteraceae bacterium]|nr:SEC-C metal-binding domain-containing protein [Bryobacteraceae bacterium]
MSYIAPEHYASTSAFDLLKAAEQGFIGIDQRLLHALVDDPSRTLPDIVRFADDQEAEEPLEQDLLAIFQYLHAPEGVPYLIRVLRRYSEDAPDELAEALIAVGSAALEPLLDLYEELGEEGGGEVAFVLAGLGIRDPRILKILEEYLEYDASYGAIMLSLYNDPRAIPPIERLLEQVPKDDTFLRQELGNAIRDIRGVLEQAPAAPAPPFDIFEQYPDEEGPNFEWLTAADRLSLLDPAVPPAVRAEAAGSFFNDELQHAERKRLEQVATTDPDPNVRGRAWEALSLFADEESLRQTLFHAARNAPQDERTGAIVALAASPEVEDEDKEELLSLIEPLYHNPATRAKGLEAMWKSAKQRFIRYFPPHLEDPDTDIRTHAILGTGLLRIGSEAPRLVEMFNDEIFRHTALFAYALCAPPELTRGRAKSFLRKIDQLASLSPDDIQFVEGAIDQRLVLQGLDPVFSRMDQEQGEEPEAPAPKSKVGRNDPCPCGSGKKYKKCCGVL